MKKEMYIPKTVDDIDEKDDTFIFLDDLTGTAEFLARDDLTMKHLIEFFDASKPSYFFDMLEEREGKKVVPWTQIVEKQMGQCVEMAILSQLRFQKRNLTSFLCGGKTNQDQRTIHAWNLRRREDAYVIWDCGMQFYAPVEQVTVANGALFLHPDFERSIGNTNRIIYQIGGDLW